MNYFHVYDKLIQKRRQYPLDAEGQYCEQHHILPKCLGGTDDAGNLVYLTAREHYVAHLLLAKAYDDFRLYYAVVKMRVSSRNHKRLFRFNSRLYEKIRTECYQKQSEYFKTRKFTSWNKGKKGVYSEATLRRMSESAKARKPRKFSDQGRKNMSIAHKGLKWFNDGSKSVMRKECPPGFVRGRLV